MGTCVNYNINCEHKNEILVSEHNSPIVRASFRKGITRTDYTIDKYNPLKLDLTLSKETLLIKASLTPPLRKMNNPILNRLNSKKKSKTYS